MNRLTEWYDDGEVKGILVKEYPSENSMKTLYQKFGNQTDYSDTDEGYLCAKKLKEYEDLEEQGLLLKFPCKVGDTVYVDSKTIPTENMEFEEVREVPLFFEAKVVSFRQNGNGNYIKLKVKAKWLHEWVDPDCGPDSAYFETEKYFTYPLSAIGKTVFLTQEQAEEALKMVQTPLNNMR